MLYSCTLNIIPSSHSYHSDLGKKRIQIYSGDLKQGRDLCIPRSTINYEVEHFQNHIQVVDCYLLNASTPDFESLFTNTISPEQITSFHFRGLKRLTDEEKKHLASLIGDFYTKVWKEGTYNKFSKERLFPIKIALPPDQDIFATLIIKAISTKLCEVEEPRIDNRSIPVPEGSITQQMAAITDNPDIYKLEERVKSDNFRDLTHPLNQFLYKARNLMLQSYKSAEITEFFRNLFTIYSVEKAVCRPTDLTYSWEVGKKYTVSEVASRLKQLALKMARLIDNKEFFAYPSASIEATEAQDEIMSCSIELTNLQRLFQKDGAIPCYPPSSSHGFPDGYQAPKYNTGEETKSQVRPPAVAPHGAPKELDVAPSAPPTHQPISPVGVNGKPYFNIFAPHSSGDPSKGLNIRTLTGVSITDCAGYPVAIAANINKFGAVPVGVGCVLTCCMKKCCLNLTGTALALFLKWRDLGLIDDIKNFEEPMLKLAHGKQVYERRDSATFTVRDTMYVNVLPDDFRSDGKFHEHDKLIPETRAKLYQQKIYEICESAYLNREPGSAVRTLVMTLPSTGTYKLDPELAATAAAKAIKAFNEDNPDAFNNVDILVYETGKTPEARREKEVAKAKKIIKRFSEENGFEPIQSHNLDGTSAHVDAVTGVGVTAGAPAHAGAGRSAGREELPVATPYRHPAPVAPSQHRMDGGRKKASSCLPKDCCPTNLGRFFPGGPAKVSFQLLRMLVCGIPCSTAYAAACCPCEAVCGLNALYKLVKPIDYNKNPWAGYDPSQGMGGMSATDCHIMTLVQTYLGCPPDRDDGCCDLPCSGYR